MFLYCLYTWKSCYRTARRWGKGPATLWILSVLVFYATMQCIFGAVYCCTRIQRIIDEVTRLPPVVYYFHSTDTVIRARDKDNVRCNDTMAVHMAVQIILSCWAARPDPHNSHHTVTKPQIIPNSTNNDPISFSCRLWLLSFFLPKLYIFMILDKIFMV